MEKHQLVTLLLVSNSKKYYGFIQWTIWLILPVVIRLSQRLSHACLSTSTCIVKLRMAHYISYSLFDKPTTWITVVILELIHAKLLVRGAFIRYLPTFITW